MDSALVKRLRTEVFVRSQPTSITYVFISLYLFLIRLRAGVHTPLLKAAIGLIFVLGVVRYFINRRYQRTQEITERLWGTLQVVVYVNALALSTVFVLVAWYGKFSGADFVAVTLVLTTLATASPITLASVPHVQWVFLAIIISPLCGLSLMFWKGGEETALHFLVPFMILAFYALLQGRVYHRHIVQKFRDDQELAQAHSSLLEQTAIMQHSSRLSSLGEMASGISHEINNPLTVMLGTVDLLLNAEKPREEQVEKLTRIKAAGQRISRIVRALRTFSRQSDKDPMEWVTAEKIIDVTLDFCSQRFQAEKIELTVKVEPETKVYCREVHVSQILVNLLNNALDESLRHGGRTVALQVKKAGAHVIFAVTNSGAISDEARQRIFQPFSTTKDVGKGTGLGLSISRRIAREHGGDLHFDVEGTRVTFYLSLPVPVLT